MGKRHLNSINSEFQVHYNRERQHEARAQVPPDWPDAAPSFAAARKNDIDCRSLLGRQPSWLPLKG